jgi:uncharacterized protein YndB with AHSA1/START domain
VTADDPLRLVVRRTIAASPARLFEAWTTPAQFTMWWGPKHVRCTQAEIDASVGGRYRIENELPDGRVVVIAGEFLSVVPPSELVYTWRIEPVARNAEPERVTVRFEPRGARTEVIVVHERIATQPSRDQHEAGWCGCLDGLAALVDPAEPRA